MVMVVFEADGGGDVDAENISKENLIPVTKRFNT